MKRRVLLQTCGALAGAALCESVAAQQWPSKTVTVIVPFAAGGGTTDPLARLMAEELSKSLGATFVVDNKPGANGSIGAAYVKNAAPDGHVLLFTAAGTMATNLALYKTLPYHPQKDFEPIVLVGHVANVLVVNPALPATNVKEFVDYLKKNPGKTNFATTGNGSSMHTAAELFSQATQTSMTHVPFNGAGPATTSLLSGEVPVMFHLVPGIATQVKAGKVKALAVMAPKRSPALPDVPTMAEAGFPNIESYTWLCFVAPKGTPKAVVDSLNGAVNKILAQPALRERLAGMGVEPMGGTPAEFATFRDSEIKKWGEVVRRAGVTID